MPSAPVLLLLVAILSYGAYDRLIANPVIAPCDPSPLPPLPEAVGVLEPNEVLSRARQFHGGFVRHGVFAPESFAYDGSRWVYSGIGNGKIVKFDILSEGFDVVEVAMTGKDLGDDCGKGEFEDVCGRTLGLRFHPDGFLIAADTRGLFKIEVDSGKVTHLIDGINGPVKMAFPNSVAITSDGKVYFTDSSKKWDRHRVSFLALEGCYGGSLYSYDLNTSKLELIASQLEFPNGLTLSAEGDALLFNECMRARVRKYHLEGPNKGKITEFSEGLPGRPDNIVYDKEMNLYWVALSSKRFAPFSLIDFLDDKPFLRLVIASFVPPSLAGSLMPPTGIVAAVDLEGNVLYTLQDPTGATNRISEASHVGDYLLFGSWERDNLAVLDIEEVRKFTSSKGL